MTFFWINIFMRAQIKDLLCYFDLS